MGAIEYKILTLKLVNWDQVTQYTVTYQAYDMTGLVNTPQHVRYSETPVQRPPFVQIQSGHNRRVAFIERNIW